MLGRGVKRKWSCLEELETEALPVTADKEQDVEEDGGGEGGLPASPPSSKWDLSPLQQRQLVLGLCLEKLQRYQVGMELSLRRSVLLINTLRQIQVDMPEGDVHHPDPCPLGDVQDVTCCRCAESDQDNQSPPPSPESSSPELHETLPATTVTEVVNAMGYLGDLALDDIFEDIDTSMYESSDLPSSWTPGSLWPVSGSPWADEEVKMCPAAHGSGFQSCLMDLNELDHIMEILVKS